MLPLSPGITIALLAALLSAPQRGAAKQGRGEKPAETPAADEDVAKKYFEIADYDTNGWITISEARPSLGLDRHSFALYDEDGDGRISLPEFRARYEKIVKNGGAFAAPIGKSGLRASGPASPADLALRYDKDGDGTLDRSELHTFLEELHSRLDAEVVLSKFDRDGSRRLEKGEVADLAAFLDPARRSHPGPHAASVEELFGKSIPREERKGATLLAPRILGPVPVFRRLDLDGDGRITSEDLVELQRPIQLPVRFAAVLATLDTNGDGAIDAAELDASMSGE
jgi:Ca2+-binding EF-hand superfamily protein